MNVAMTHVKQFLLTAITRIEKVVQIWPGLICV